MEAELTLRNFPSKPDPSISPELVAVSCCRSLQFVDHPSPDDGLRRIFPFFTWECRKAVTARRGGDVLERFVEHGSLSPALQPFMGATRIEVGEGTLTPKTQTRGDLVSFPVKVHGAAVLAFQHSSGLIRDRVGEEPPITDMVMRLEQQRRPPMQGCWLVREVLDVRHAFAGDMGNAHVGG
uniref:Tim44-like domain-containing protein n=1 Tax=Trieres chinensis TaxID=1514140 RepID=A0A7S1Z2H3_TRICV|mmetsp:Transcript_16261/g.33383  ORF Transcript_16261/g.33383 Transcript_16261/m.33383 type:complete len:181 (+) Transcript_16261:3-545(+)